MPEPTVAEQCRAWLVDELRFAPRPEAPGWLVSPDDGCMVLDLRETAWVATDWPWASLAEFQASTRGLLALKPATRGQPAVDGTAQWVREAECRDSVSPEASRG